MPPESRSAQKGRVPPQDIEAEKCVLGSVLLVNETLDDVLLHLKAESFFSFANAQIFRAVERIHRRGERFDAVTVARELQKAGCLEEIGGARYLCEVLETVPHAAHAEYYARIVRDKFLMRRLVEVCTDSLREAYSGDGDAADVLSKAERRIFGIIDHQEADGNISIKEILKATFNRIFERMDQGGGVTGLSSGLFHLDDFTSGFQATELIVLAARPSMGKTALVCNFAIAAAKAGKGVLIFSLEQSRLELAERLLCIQAKMSGSKLRKGDLGETDQQALMGASEQLEEMPIFIDDQCARTVSQISSIARRIKRRGRVDVLIIDYLQLLESEDRNLPYDQQVANITRRLKFLAKDLSIPVVALSQLNRGVEQREDKRPRLSDLRASGAIEQDADVVMFLHRPEAYDPTDRPGEADLIIAKNRHGPIGTVELVWLKEMLKFGDKSTLF